MPTDFEINQYDNRKTKDIKGWKKQVWEDLIEFAKGKKINKEKAIIVGDFNAYIGCDRTLTEKKFIELSRYANDITPDDIPTFIGDTPIDHIFVNFNTQQKYDYHIENDFKFSDHKYMTAEFDIAENKGK